MRHVPIGLLFRFLPLVAAGLLAGRFGIGLALAVVIGTGLVSVTIGAWLLRGAPVGSIGWRNLVASWLMPWGHVLGGPRLLDLASSAFVGWVLLALAGAIGWSEPWLLAAWVFDGIALAWLTSLARRCRGDRLQRRVVGRLIGIVVVLAFAGLAAHLLGHPRVGALVAGGPVALVGVVFGLWAGLFSVLRPSRYN